MTDVPADDEVGDLGLSGQLCRCCKGRGAVQCPFCLKWWHAECAQQLLDYCNTLNVLAEFIQIEEGLLSSIRVNKVPFPADCDWWQVLVAGKTAGSSASSSSLHAGPHPEILCCLQDRPLGTVTHTPMHSAWESIVRCCVGNLRLTILLYQPVSLWLLRLVFRASSLFLPRCRPPAACRLCCSVLTERAG